VNKMKQQAQLARREAVRAQHAHHVGNDVVVRMGGLGKCLKVAQQKLLEQRRRKDTDATVMR